jgi:hypothetical protein
MTSIIAASALIDALAALHKAEQAINDALSAIKQDAPAPVTRQMVAVRTTGTQVLSVLSASAEPLTLIDIADGVVAIRRGEDTPKPHGGTRYQEMCRTALQRLILRGLVRRVEPTDKRGLMKFERIIAGNKRQDTP